MNRNYLLEQFTQATRIRLDEMAKAAGPASVRKQLQSVSTDFHGLFAEPVYVIYQDGELRTKRDKKTTNLKQRLAIRKEMLLKAFKPVVDDTLDNFKQGNLRAAILLNSPWGPSKPEERSNFEEVKSLLGKYEKSGKSQAVLEDLYDFGFNFYLSKSSDAEKWPHLILSPGEVKHLSQSKGGSSERELKSSNIGKPGSREGESKQTNRKYVTKELASLINQGCCTFIKNTWNDERPDRLQLEFDFEKSLQKFSTTWDARPALKSAIQYFMREHLGEEREKEFIGRAGMSEKNSLMQRMNAGDPTVTIEDLRNANLRIRREFFKFLIDTPEFHPIKNNTRVMDASKAAYLAAAYDIEKIQEGSNEPVEQEVVKTPEEQAMEDNLLNLEGMIENMEILNDLLSTGISPALLSKLYRKDLPMSKTLRNQLETTVPDLSRRALAAAQPLGEALQAIHSILTQAEEKREKHKPAPVVSAPVTSATEQIENIKKEVEEALMDIDFAA